MPVRYAIVRDSFGEEGWVADVIIQTEDESGYDDFSSALEAVIESIRSRIEEEGVDPDEAEVPLEPETNVEKLCQMLSDLEGDEPEDWESYAMLVSQPYVFLGEPSESTRVNLAEVEDRKRAMQWLTDNPMNIKAAEIKKDLARIGFPQGG
jgi:hypothetical protein